jgi:DNA-binding transcriptional ArsR family regulator
MRVAELAGPARADIELVEVLQALADPVRLQIVRELAAADGPIACHEFAIPVAKSTGSHHLKVLREAGVVVSERQGTNIVYSLSPDFARRWAGIAGSFTNLVQIA